MKFKEIKPGMVIHCPTEENAKELLKHLDELGYVWNSGSNLLKDTMYSRYKGEICYCIESVGITYGSIGNFRQSEFDITEFSDLLEPELTAEEAVEWLAKHYYDNEYKNAFGLDYNMDELLEDMTPSEIVAKIAQWKADHEKKEPEVEWVDICRIIENLPDGRKKCVYEEEIVSELPSGGDEKEKIEEVLKRYCMEHEGNFFAVHEIICRIKEED